MEASEAIEAYQKVLPPPIFQELRSEAIAVCNRVEATATESVQNTPEKHIVCCCADSIGSDHDDGSGSEGYTQEWEQFCEGNRKEKSSSVRQHEGCALNFCA